MLLGELREQMVKMSGRYDLVIDTTNYEDNGADFYINSGQRWLDRKSVDRLTISRALVIAAANAITVTFPLCRSVQSVWVIDAVEGTRTQLERKTLQEIRTDYLASVADLASGTPLYYTPTYTTALVSRPSVADLAAYASFPDVIPPSGSGDVYDGILFAPPCLNEVLFEVWGRFYNTELVDNGSFSYWTIQHPDVLIMAALRQVEVFHRNSEGVKDWTTVIEQALAEIDQDAAEDELADGPDQMEG